jgi:hypothetical protein
MRVLDLVCLFNRSVYNVVMTNYSKSFSCVDSNMWKIDVAMCLWCCWGIVYVLDNKEDPCPLRFVRFNSNAPRFQVCFLPRACLLPIIPLWAILL